MSDKSDSPDPQSFRSRLLTLDASGLCIVAALTGAAYFLGAAPVLNARAGISEQRQLLEEQARHAADLEGRIVVEQRKLADVKKRLDEVSVPLHPASDINKRLQKITELSDAHRLVIQHIDPGQPKSDPDAGKFTVVPIRIIGVGSFTGVSGFLDSLLAVSYKDVEVSEMNVSAPPEGQSDAAFVIDLRWYAEPAANAASAAVEPQK